MKFLLYYLFFQVFYAGFNLLLYGFSVGIPALLLYWFIELMDYDITDPNMPMMIVYVVFGLYALYHTTKTIQLMVATVAMSIVGAHKMCNVSNKYGK